MFSVSSNRKNLNALIFALFLVAINAEYFLMSTLLYQWWFHLHAAITRQNTVEELLRRNGPIENVCFRGFWWNWALRYRCDCMSFVGLLARIPGNSFVLDRNDQWLDVLITIGTTMSHVYDNRQFCHIIQRMSVHFTVTPFHIKNSKLSRWYRRAACGMSTNSSKRH